MDKLKEEFGKTFGAVINVISHDSLNDKICSWFFEKLKDQRRKAFDDAIGICDENIEDFSKTPNLYETSVLTCECIKKQLEVERDK